MLWKKVLFSCVVFLGGLIHSTYSMKPNNQNLRLGYQDVITGADYYVIHGKNKCFRSYKSIICTAQECPEINTIDHSKGFVIAYYNTQHHKIATLSSQGLEELSKNMLHAYAQSRLDLPENYAPPFSYGELCYDACIIS